MSPNMTTLHTVDDVIEMFGGPSAAARWARVSANAVCWWRKRGIPPGVHLRLLIEARRRGHIIAPELLELEDDEGEELRELLSGGGSHAAA